jgi:hypothetical protein
MEIPPSAGRLAAAGPPTLIERRYISIFDTTTAPYVRDGRN